MFAKDTGNGLNGQGSDAYKEIYQLYLNDGTESSVKMLIHKLGLRSNDFFTPDSGTTKVSIEHEWYLWGMIVQINDAADGSDFKPFTYSKTANGGILQSETITKVDDKIWQDNTTTEEEAYPAFIGASRNDGVVDGFHNRF